MFVLCASVVDISTHSLTRRLTTSELFLYSLFTISTHSLTRRLTWEGLRLKTRDDLISTHSLTRRLTLGYAIALNTFAFQLTASQGGWRKLRHRRPFRWIISTHSLTRRLTISERSSVVWIFYFNSQPHKEADQLNGKSLQYVTDFNSQPHKEADKFSWHESWLVNYFNSQPHKEADELPF